MKVLISFLLLITVLTLTSSCKKEDFSLETTKYHAETLERSGIIRVFTKRGEITNQNVLAEIIRRDSSSLSNTEFYLLKNSEGDTVQVIDEQNAEIRRASFTITYERAKRKRLARFTAKDTSIRYTHDEVMDRTIDYHIGKFKAVIVNESLRGSAGGNYYFTHKTLHQFYAFTGNNELKAPNIIVRQHRPVHDRVFSVQNVLDPYFFKILSETDTISLREVNIIYRIVK